MKKCDRPLTSVAAGVRQPGEILAIRTCTLYVGPQIMKVASSLKTLKARGRNCQIVRRRGRLYVINKKNPRLKARQG